MKRLNIALILLYVVIVLPLWAGLLNETQASSPVFSTISRQRENIREQSKIAVLNLLMPSGYGDLSALSRSGRAQSADLPLYLRYYQQAASVLPAPLSADAHAMAGFCYFHLGKLADSKESYLKALNDNPSFIWTYANLAVLSFREGDYEKTVLFSNQALGLNPEISMKVIASSKIYADIVRDTPGGIDWPAEIKSAYSAAGRMMVMSFFRMGKYPETLKAAQYAVSSGFEPAPFFYYYIGRALEASGDPVKAQEFLTAAGPAAEQSEPVSGRDLSVRIF